MNHHLEFLSLKGSAQAQLSLRMSKCHIVGNISAHLCIIREYLIVNGVVIGLKLQRNGYGVKNDQVMFE